jgi:hypothetical protein
MQIPVLTRCRLRIDTSSMQWPCIRRFLVSVTVVCVAALFFFPLSYGTFQATHGPTTEFRAQRAAVAIVLSIASAVLEVSSLPPDAASLPACSLKAQCSDLAESLPAPPSSAILRC